MHGLDICSSWKRQTTLVPLLWLILNTGCGGSNGIDMNSGAATQVKRESAERLRALKYPGEEFMTAWGYSDGSQREAEDEAKVRISEQINSSIRSETRSVAQAWMRNGEVEDHQFLEWVVHSETRFDRAELIHLDTSLMGHSPDGQYQAFAYLRRSDYGAELAASYDDLAIAFRAEVVRAGGFINKPLAFTAPWNSAREIFHQLYSLACQHKVVLGFPPPTLGEDRLLLREIHRMRREALARLSIAVILEPSSEIDSYALTTTVNAALVRLGLNVVSGGCTSDKMLGLKLQPELTWNQLMGSRFCKLRLLGEILDCAEDQVRQTIIVSGSDMEGRGSDPVSSLARRVTAEKLAPLLEQALREVLPLETRLE